MNTKNRNRNNYEHAFNVVFNDSMKNNYEKTGIQRKILARKLIIPINNKDTTSLLYLDEAIRIFEKYGGNESFDEFYRHEKTQD